MHFIENNFSDIYHNIISHVYDKPDFIMPQIQKESLNISFTLTNIYNIKINNNYRTPNYKYAKEYFNHLISGKTNIDKLARINPIVKKFVDSTGLPINFTSQYGPRIKDQLSRVLQLLTENPNTRRAIINILDKDDKIIWDIETTHEYPCTNIIHFFIRDNKFYTLVQMRSNNILTTIFYDIFLFTNLMKHVYKIVKLEFPNLELGEYHHQISSAHILFKDYKTAKSLLKGAIYE